MRGTYVRLSYAYLKQRVISSGLFRGSVDIIMKLVHKTKTGTRMNVVQNLRVCRETKKNNALTLNRTAARLHHSLSCQACSSSYVKQSADEQTGQCCCTNNHACKWLLL